MNTLDLGRASQDRELRDDELGAVSGGNEGYPGLPLGSNINVFGFEPVGLRWRHRPSTGTGRTLNRGEHATLRLRW